MTKWNIEPERLPDGDVVITREHGRITVCHVHCHGGDREQAEDTARLIVKAVEIYGAAKELHKKKFQAVLDKEFKNIMAEQTRALIKETEEES